MSSNASVHCSTCRSSSCCPRTASRRIARRSTACFPEWHPRGVALHGVQQVLQSNRTEEATMYAVIRAYTGKPELADALAERAEDTRQVIGGLNAVQYSYIFNISERMTS